jgi:hypothetical protein
MESHDALGERHHRETMFESRQLLADICVIVSIGILSILASIGLVALAMRYLR